MFKKLFLHINIDIALTNIEVNTYKIHQLKILGKRLRLLDHLSCEECTLMISPKKIKITM